MASASGGLPSGAKRVTQRWHHATPRCADSVEALSLADGSSLVAVAGYELNKETDTREGAIEAFFVGGSGSGEPAFDVQAIASETSLAGVLDAKWSPLRAGPGVGQGILGVASADGSLSAWAVVEEAGGSRKWSKLAEAGLGDPADPPIVLSLAWAGTASDAPSCEVAASRRDGLISVLACEAGAAGAELNELESWLAHSYGPGVGAEAWIVGVNPHAGEAGRCQQVWTGGDDGTLKGWDMREPAAGSGTRRRRRPTFAAELGAGVCSCQWNPVSEFTVATGGYDGVLRVWDTRKTGSSVSGEDCLAAAETGGGVWRIKWRPGSGDAILTASMRGGARLFAWAEEQRLVPTASTLVHGAESLTYGADWLLLAAGAAEEDTIGTCSFYNNEFRVWTA